MAGTVHVIGAGLAGLAAAVRLAGTGAKVVVHEATGQPGGRCRSYFDQATGLTIDNGNHLLLSGNHAALGFVRMLGTEDRLVGPPTPEFAFMDLASRERWTLRISEGRLPWWIFDPRRRVPGTRAAEYLRVGRLLLAGKDATVASVIDCNGRLYKRLLQPLLVAALNVDPPQGAAVLAAAIVRESLLAGGAACRPLIARTGLGEVFIDPAVEQLRRGGNDVLMRHELRGLRFEETRVSGLDFGSETIPLGAEDAVILAVPPYAASPLVPLLKTPTAFRAIVNAHFRVDPPPGFPPMIGVLNATTEWIFAFPQRLSVTVSNGDRLLDTPREELARTLWQEVAAVAGPAGEMPRWQIVRERRATFAATPEENAKRPGAQTSWRNLFLAGDWTDTGLPATIESAVRSGFRAAELVERS
jgi:squalene-associated FAD-dependent desaturase